MPVVSLPVEHSWACSLPAQVRAASRSTAARPTSAFISLGPGCKSGTWMETHPAEADAQRTDGAAAGYPPVADATAWQEAQRSLSGGVLVPAARAASLITPSVQGRMLPDTAPHHGAELHHGAQPHGSTHAQQPRAMRRSVSAERSSWVRTGSHAAVHFLSTLISCWLHGDLGPWHQAFTTQCTMFMSGMCTGEHTFCCIAIAVVVAGFSTTHGCACTRSRALCAASAAQLPARTREHLGRNGRG
jgi:hypothetical protein